MDKRQTPKALVLRERLDDAMERIIRAKLALARQGVLVFRKNANIKDLEYKLMQVKYAGQGLPNWEEEKELLIDILDVTRIEAEIMMMEYAVLEMSLGECKKNYTIILEKYSNYLHE